MKPHGGIAKPRGCADSMEQGAMTGLSWRPFLHSAAAPFFLNHSSCQSPAMGAALPLHRRLPEG